MPLQQKSLEYVTLYAPQISFSPSPGFLSNHWASLACSAAQPRPPHYNVLGSEWVYNYAILQNNHRVQHILVNLTNLKPSKCVLKKSTPLYYSALSTVEWSRKQEQPLLKRGGGGGRADIRFPVATHTTAVGIDTKVAGPCQLSLYRYLRCLLLKRSEVDVSFLHTGIFAIFCLMVSCQCQLSL
jgi:hypothetical protein